jgi:hypothetical protein
MIRYELLNLKILPHKILLAWLLFFSFVTIAGGGGKTNALIEQTFGIELLYSIKGSPTNKTVLFGKYFPPVNKVTFHCRKYGLIILLVHNNISKVKFNSLSKKINTIPIPVRYFPIKLFIKAPVKITSLLSHHRPT